MRAKRPFLTILTVLALVALGYVVYTLSASVHPGPAPPPSAHPLERDE